MTTFSRDHGWYFDKCEKVRNTTENKTEILKWKITLKWRAVVFAAIYCAFYDFLSICLYIDMHFFFKQSHSQKCSVVRLHFSPAEMKSFSVLLSEFWVTTQILCINVDTLVSAVISFSVWITSSGWGWILTTPEIFTLWPVTCVITWAELFC